MATAIKTIKNGRTYTLKSAPINGYKFVVNNSDITLTATINSPGGIEVQNYGNVTYGLPIAAYSTAPITIDATSTFTFTPTATKTFSGGINGAGMVVKTGTGTIRFSGGNKTYSGGFHLVQGTCTCLASNCLGTGVVTLEAGTVLNKSGYSIPNTIINNGGTVNP